MKFLFGFSIVSCMIFVAEIRAEPTPPIGEFRIDGAIDYRGKGCPGGSVRAAVSEDSQAITIFFDRYTLTVGPDTAPATSSDCDLWLPLSIPRGWQIALMDLIYRGYLYLEEAVEARFTSGYEFQGTNVPKFQSTWTGPIEMDLRFSGPVRTEYEEKAWSPCNKQRPLVVRTRVFLKNTRNRNGFGMVGTDSVDAEIGHIYGVEWRRCEY